MTDAPELNVRPDEERRMGAAERHEYDYLHMLDTRGYVRQVIGISLIGLVLNSLWQAFADWLFPTGSLYVVLTWLATLFVVLLLFNRWNAWDQAQRYTHLSKFEHERLKRQAREVDPHSSERAKLFTRA
jgi:hypothetical protein